MTKEKLTSEAIAFYLRHLKNSLGPLCVGERKKLIKAKISTLEFDAKEKTR